MIIGVGGKTRLNVTRRRCFCCSRSPEQTLTLIWTSIWQAQDDGVARGSVHIHSSEGISRGNLVQSILSIAHNLDRIVTFTHAYYTSARSLLSNPVFCSILLGLLSSCTWACYQTSHQSVITAVFAKPKYPTLVVNQWSWLGFKTGGFLSEWTMYGR